MLRYQQIFASLETMWQSRAGVRASLFARMRCSESASARLALGKGALQALVVHRVAALLHRIETEEQPSIGLARIVEVDYHGRKHTKLQHAACP